MITGLQGAIIWTEDIGRLSPFYRDVLGFKPQFEGDEFVAFEAAAGGVQLGLASTVRLVGSRRTRSG